MAKRRYGIETPGERDYLKLIYWPRRITFCSICGALVGSGFIKEHMMGDEVMLRIIGLNNPDWTAEECLDYYILTYQPGARKELRGHAA